MERYYYETESDGVTCTELCEYSKIEECGQEIEVRIGSLLCKQCENNIAYDCEEKFIKCEIYSLFIENENLKDKIKQLDREIFLLKGGA